MDQLTDSHKQALQNLVKLVRDKEIPEEFRVLWEMGTMLGSVPKLYERKTVRIPCVTRIALDILAREANLFDATFDDILRTVEIPVLLAKVIEFVLSFRPALTPLIRVFLLPPYVR